MTAKNPETETLRLWLWLTQSEKALIKMIRLSDTPFLGLIGETLTPPMRQAVNKAISAYPTVAGYIRHLETNPALFAVNLTWHVMNGMGQNGYFSVYPSIERALCLSKGLNQNEAESLWQAFRRTLLHLGLEPSPQTSGSHFMVNEYLRQAGVPLSFVDDLAQKMLAFARKAGVPDDDNPEDIASWQTALDTLLEPPFSVTARNALAFDRHGYYTRTFLRVYAVSGATQDGENKVEAAMARAFKDSAIPLLPRSVIPQVIFRDRELNIFFPAGVEQGWTVTVDGVVRKYNTGAEERLLAIDQALPREVKVHSHSGEQKLQVRLWEDEKLNRLLFFTDTGRLAGRAQLGQEAAQTLPPGTYSVLARFSPTGVEAELVSTEPRVFCFFLFLRPNEGQRFCNGPAELIVLGSSQPSTRWRGATRSSKDGVEFRYGPLNLDVEIPKDWLTFNTSYELMLHPGDRGEARALPLILDGTGEGTVRVSEVASEAAWSPGLMRLLIELRRTGESRVLLRTAVLYWLGLEDISGALRFRCTSWPQNLKQELSENITRKGNDLALEDSFKRGVRLVFSLSEKRQQSLTWNTPGVFVEVETIADNGSGHRVQRILGSREVVSLTSGKQITVSASESGLLCLGEWAHRVDFSRHSKKVLSASFLASRLTSQSSTLVYVNENTGAELKLLRLTQPHEAHTFVTQAQSGQFVVRLHMSEAMDALSMRALSLLSGEEDLFTLQSNANEWVNGRFGRARLLVLNDNQTGYVAHLYINFSLWPAGAWLFNFDCEVGGVWGQLENSGQAIFSAGLLLGDGGQVLSQPTWFNLVQALDDGAAYKLLQRVHAALLICYAQEAWDGLLWLPATWKILTERWLGREAEVVGPLVDLIAMRPPAEVSVSWPPQFALASRLPRLFALPAEKYRRVNEKTHPISQGLRVIGLLDALWPRPFHALLHHASAAACMNFAAVSSQGASPRDFHPQRYLDALCAVPELEYIYQLSDDDYVQKQGDYLGPLHYRCAWRALEAAYERALAGNNINGGQGLGMARYAWRVYPHLKGHGVPRAWQNRAPHLIPWPIDSDSMFDDLAHQQRENLWHIAHVLASLAFACRQEVRLPGTLMNYLNQLKNATVPLDGPLAFLLQVGEALFAYYLLLWELALKAEE